MSNYGMPRNAGQRPRRKITPKTKLRDTPFWAELLRSLDEPFELKAYIEGDSLVVRRCGICGRRHVHGYTGEEVGSLTPRMNHCVNAPGVPIMLRVMEATNA